MFAIIFTVIRDEGDTVGASVTSASVLETGLGQTQKEGRPSSGESSLRINIDGSVSQME